MLFNVNVLYANLTTFQSSLADKKDNQIKNMGNTNPLLINPSLVKTDHSDNYL